MKKIYPLLLLCYLLNPLDSGAQKKYNVIFIAADDLSIAFDAYGYPDVQLPNFARLIQHGMIFPQTYCQYALCSPSRTSIMSGKRPDSTGVFGNIISIRSTLGEDYRFLPEYFNDYGYRTEKFGKVASCKHEDEVYWDYVLEGQGETRYGLRGTPDWWIDTSVKTVQQTVEGQITGALIEKIKQPVATPYFYGLGLSTHNPYTPILSSWNKLGDPLNKELLPVDINGTITNVLGNGSGNITLPDTPPNDTADIPPIALKDPIYYPPEEVQRIRHAYYGEMIELDEQLGAVLDELDILNLWESTVVVFWSDHGEQMGEHLGQWLKLTLFEECLRVPFVICAPGKKTGVCNKPVELVDIFSTLAELCGLPAPLGQQGSSLVPLLENPNAQWKKAIFAQVQRFVNNNHNDTLMGRAARTNTYHYNSWQDQGEELYNVVLDPYEYTNLARHSEAAAVLNHMRNLLAEGWQGALPPVYIQSVYYRDADGDGYGKNHDSTIAYFAPDGYANKKGDCNDNDARIHPGANEKVCNGKDDNCNGSVDENKPQPTITPLGSLDICATGSVVLRTEKGPGFSYQWKRNGNNISGATSRTYTATIKGKYKVEITYNGCSSLSESAEVTSSCNASVLSNEITSSEKLSIYPNPSTGIITITYNSNSAGKIDLKVYDRIGKIVFSKADKAITGKNTYELNLVMLKPGVYDVELNNGALPIRSKLILDK